MMLLNFFNNNLSLFLWLVRDTITLIQDGNVIWDTTGKSGAKVCNKVLPYWI